jgi:glycosyltransferase involved in cell wall biosynthesis
LDGKSEFIAISVIDTVWRSGNSEKSTPLLRPLRLAIAIMIQFSTARNFLMPKACHVTSGHEVTDTRILKRECTLLKEKGFDVTLMAQQSGQEAIDGILIHSLPAVGTRWYQRLFLSFPILVKMLKEQNDLVHFHDPDLLGVMLAYSRLKRKPVVWDAHEDYESVITSTNKFVIPALSRVMGKLYSFLELRACQLARARVVTVSEVMADRYRQAGLETIACANYVDHRRVPFPPEIDRATPPLIIMTGTIRDGCFAAELLDAFSTVRIKFSSRLAFWGDLWPALRRELEEQARLSGIDYAVECAGPFPWERLVTQLIPQSTVAVYIADPSIAQICKEIPNRIFEYWANGVPVVVAKGTLCAEMVSYVKGGLTVNYGSVAELVTALQELLSNPDLTKMLGANGRRAVQESYNWTREGTKLIDLYARTLENGFPKVQSPEGLLS